MEVYSIVELITTYTNSPFALCFIYYTNAKNVLNAVFSDDRFDIKWVDDTHAIGSFSSAEMGEY